MRPIIWLGSVQPSTPRIVMRQLLSRGCLALLLTLGITATWAGTEISPGALRMERESGVPGVAGDVSDELEDEIDSAGADGDKRGELVIAPLPSRSPLVGWTLSLPVMYIYKPENSAEQDRPWISGLGAFYTQNDSWGGGLFHKMSTGGDLWRINGALFYADLNYDYFGIGGNDTVSVPLSQSMSLGLAEVLRQFFIKNLFLGFKTVYSNTEVSATLPAGVLPPEIDPVSITQDYVLLTIAPRVKYDTRDSDFYPRTGMLIDGTVGISSTSLGSDNSFEKYTLEANYYHPIGSAGVFASRLNSQYVAGDAPFFLFPAYGADVDLRGYQTGTYRDRFLLAAQIEYRHRFTKRIGAVAFAGVGPVAPKFGQWDTSLPSLGGGLRYVLAEKNDLSLRVDYAWGRDDQQFYVGIGEAF